MPVLPEFSLSGRVAVLHTTGGDHAPFFAQALAQAGALVFTIARRQELLDPVLESLSSYPAGHRGVVADVGRDGPSGVAAAMSSFDQLDSPVDILVNDTRSLLAGPLDAITAHEWDELHSRNVRSTFFLTQEVARRMQERQYGRIVNVISILAERAMANSTAFASTQAGLLSLTKCLALEFGASNIRVNALGLGWFTTEDLPLEQQQQELLVRFTPLRRKGHPTDVGPLLVYLSSEACDYATGQPVYVDGGLNAHP